MQSEKISIHIIYFKITILIKNNLLMDTTGLKYFFKLTVKHKLVTLKIMYLFINYSQVFDALAFYSFKDDFKKLRLYDFFL